MVENKKAYSYFFKATLTGLVLCVAISIVALVTKSEIWSIVITIGVLSFIALVVGIILSIWNT